MSKYWNSKESIQRETIFEDSYNYMVCVLAITS